MWFEYLKDIQEHEYMFNQPLRLVEYLEVSEDVKAYVIQAIDEMKNYRGWTIIEDETTQEEVSETIETVEVAVNGVIYEMDVTKYFEESNPHDEWLDYCLGLIDLVDTSKLTKNINHL